MISPDAIRGYVDIMILSRLNKGPSYAYEMAKAITQQTDGIYVIKQTTLYSALKRLEASTWVESYPGESPSGKPRTYYRMTPLGHTTLLSKTEEWQQTKIIVDRFVEGVH